MKTIVITGAASGVGYEVAKMLKNENLILIDKCANADTNSTLNKFKNAKFYVCDISDVNNIKQTFKKIEQDVKTIDILINCAGLWTKGELTKQYQGHFAEINTFEKIKHIIDTNTYGTIAMIKSVLPFMQKQGYGQIVNINSQSGVVIEEFCPIYNASKHGSRAFSQAILTDLAKHNIKLTDICPGLIKTDFYVNANDPLPEEIMRTGLDPKEVANVVNYVINLPSNITIPSIEIKDMKNF